MNAKAVSSVVFGLLAVAVLAFGAAAARLVDDVGLSQAVLAVPAGFVLSVLTLSLARRARFDYQRTLGRIGGAGSASLGRFLGMTGLLISLTAAGAVGVYYVLELVLD